MRNRFVKALLKLAKEDERVYLLTGDLGFMVFEDYQKEMGKRFINVGVAEANMTGVAAGLALSGKIVFTYSIIPFATYRCYEQIRNDLCYHKLNVRVVGVGSGYSYGIMGSTHHALEDIAAMSAIPDMTVCCPGDPIEVEAVINASIDYQGPIYVRLAKAGEPDIHKAPLFNLRIGEGIQIEKGKDIAIITTGNMLENSYNIVQRFKEVNISAGLFSFPTIKPMDVDLLNRIVNEFNFIVTVEEHYLNGGLSSIVAYYITSFNLEKRTRFKGFFVQGGFAEKNGTQDYLRRIQGIDQDSLFNAINKFYHG